MSEQNKQINSKFVQGSNNGKNAATQDQNAFNQQRGSQYSNNFEISQQNPNPYGSLNANSRSFQKPKQEEKKSIKDPRQEKMGFGDWYSKQNDSKTQNVNKQSAQKKKEKQGRTSEVVVPNQMKNQQYQNAQKSQSMIEVEPPADQLVIQNQKSQNKQQKNAGKKNENKQKSDKNKQNQEAENLNDSQHKEIDYWDVQGDEQQKHKQAEPNKDSKKGKKQQQQQMNTYSSMQQIVPKTPLAKSIKLEAEPDQNHQHIIQSVLQVKPKKKKRYVESTLDISKGTNVANQNSAAPLQKQQTEQDNKEIKDQQITQIAQKSMSQVVPPTQQPPAPQDQQQKEKEKPVAQTTASKPPQMIRSKSQQNLKPGKRSKEEKRKRKATQQQNLPRQQTTDKNEKSESSQNQRVDPATQIANDGFESDCDLQMREGYEKKIHKLDPDAKTGKQELLVISIATKDRVIEATVREGTNLQFLNEKISILGDFKSCPKKFKEIFLNYLRDQYDSVRTNNKLQVIGGSNDTLLPMGTQDFGASGQYFNTVGGMHLDDNFANHMDTNDFNMNNMPIFPNISTLNRQSHNIVNQLSQQQDLNDQNSQFSLPLYQTMPTTLAMPTTQEGSDASQFLFNRPPSTSVKEQVPSEGSDKVQKSTDLEEAKFPMGMSKVSSHQIKQSQPLAQSLDQTGNDFIQNFQMGKGEKQTAQEGIQQSQTNLFPFQQALNLNAPSIPPGTNLVPNIQSSSGNQTNSFLNQIQMSQMNQNTGGNSVRMNASNSSTTNNQFQLDSSSNTSNLMNNLQQNNNQPQFSLPMLSQQQYPQFQSVPNQMPNFGLANNNLQQQLMQPMYGIPQAPGQIQSPSSNMPQIPGFPSFNQQQNLPLMTMPSMTNNSQSTPMKSSQKISSSGGKKEMKLNINSNQSINNNMSNFISKQHSQIMDANQANNNTSNKGQQNQTQQFQGMATNTQNNQGKNGQQFSQQTQDLQVLQQQQQPQQCSQSQQHIIQNVVFVFQMGNQGQQMVPHPNMQQISNMQGQQQIEKEEINGSQGIANNNNNGAPSSKGKNNQQNQAQQTSQGRSSRRQQKTQYGQQQYPHQMQQPIQEPATDLMMNNNQYHQQVANNPNLNHYQLPPPYQVPQQQASLASIGQQSSIQTHSQQPANMDKKQNEK